MARSNDTFFHRGGLWVIMQFILMVSVLFAPLFSSNGSASIASLTTGILCIGVGGYFGIEGVRVLGRNRTPFPKPCAGSELIQTGIYSRVRHPLYTSVILISFGWGLLWHNTASLILSAALALFLNAKARHEEAWLTEHFPDYPDYSQRVPRFIPRFK